ncbi:MAG: PDZ domain-containing protein, partial [Anaerolineales bacterium]|nr:PDZ domain-containing protein [Anaerolineales bacterium]
VVGENISGIWVASVKSGSAADLAGIEAGDVILTIEDLILSTDGTMADYCDILRTHNPGDVLNVQVLRYADQLVLEGQINGSELTSAVSLAQPTQAPPSQAPAPTTPPTLTPASLIPSNLQPISNATMERLQPIVELPYEGVFNPIISPDGRYLSMHLGGLSGLDRYATVVVDLATGQEVFAVEDETTGIVFSQDSSSIYVLDRSDLLEVNLQTGQQTVLYHSASHCAALTSDARWLATIENQGQSATIQLVDIRAGVIRHTLSLDASLSDNNLDFSPDGRFLVAGFGFSNSSISAYGFFTFWDVATGEFIHTLNGYEQIALNPSSSTIAATIPDRGTISIIDINDFELIHYFGLSGEQNIWQPRFTHDGRMVFVKQEGSLHFWDAESGRDLGVLELPNPIEWMDLSDDLTLLAATDYTHRITIWGVLP